MYTVFDEFLSTPAWIKSHPLEDSRFFHALSKVVRRPDFDPEAMGIYFRTRCVIPSGNDKAAISERIVSLVTRARQVQDLLKAAEPKAG